MTILEIYNKLLARGMPEHPRLKYAHECWFIALCKADDPWELLDVEPDGSVPDARAIITMHALEWWLSLEDSAHTRIAKATQRGARLFDVDEESEFVIGAGLVATAPTILEAIEVATRHLEPKEKP